MPESAPKRRKTPPTGLWRFVRRRISSVAPAPCPELAAASTKDSVISEATDALTVQGLISNVQESNVRVRRSLDNGDALIVKHAVREAVLARALSSARVGVEDVGSTVGDMLESFRLMQHHPLWSKALDRLQAFAQDTDEPTIAQLSHLACAALEDGDPSGEPHSAAVLLLQPGGTLYVAAATEEAVRVVGGRMKPLAVWSDKSPNPLTRDAFAVLRSGRETLRSPFGTFPGASLAPLLQKDGRPYGVLVSGPSARPDELVHRTARMAGPLIERAWKRAAVHALGRLAASWVRHNGGGRLTDALFVPSTEESAPPDEWTPLQHQHGSTLRGFSMAVRESDGALYGTLDARVMAHVPVDAAALTLLHATGAVVQQAAAEISAMRVGDAVSVNTLLDVSERYEQAGPAIAARLQGQIHSRLRALDPNKLIAEMRTYPTPDEKVKQVLIAVLVLFGRQAKALRSWADVKGELSSQLTKELLALDVADGSKGWAESARATRGLDLDTLLEEAPLPVAAILRWLIAVRLVRDVALGFEKKADKAGAATAAIDGAVEAAGKAFAAAGKVVPARKGSAARPVTPLDANASSAPSRRMRIAAAVRSASKKAIRSLGGGA